MPLRSLACLLVAALLSACAARRSPIGHHSAPDPSGCYVEVFAREELEGTRDFINGPAKHWKLDELPFDSNWHRRIRSFRVGPTATVTLWTREGFEGEWLRFGPDRTSRRMPEGFSGQIASLQIGCSQPPAE